MFLVSVQEVLTILIIILDVYFVFKILTSKGSMVYKILWSALIIFLPVVGLILYLLLAKNAA